MTLDKKPHDVLVCGAGLVGLTAAYALAKAGNCVAICAPQSPLPDKRTTALLNDSVNYLEQLGIWELVAKKTHPLKVMRLVDGTSRLFRIPQADFHSAEIGLDAFGYNVRNHDLHSVLLKDLQNNDMVSIVDGSLTSLDASDPTMQVAQITDQEGREVKLNCRFVVGADGRNSAVRSFFGNSEQTWSYPQSAIVLDFEHQFSSGFTSTEFHTETGPFTIVPQSDRRAGLVWLETPDRARAISQMKDQELNRLLEEKMQSFLGKISVTGSITEFPMSGLTANRFGDQYHALIGEAAHVFPPIGAQGFNLGIRDISNLVSVLKRFTSAENRGFEYHNLRYSDVKSRTLGVDLLNRSLLSEFVPVQFLRGAGVLALNKFAPLRLQAMKLGMSSVIPN